MLFQSVTIAEVVVVDATVGEGIASVVHRYQGAGVRDLRVASEGVFQTYRAGLEATVAEVLCFLDADDVLSAGYLERGLLLFAKPGVGIVYSDVEYFGKRTGRTFAAAFDPYLIEGEHAIHAGSLVRRWPGNRGRLPGGPGDRVSRRLGGRGRVIEAGWNAVPQPAVYRRGTHGEPWPSRGDEPRLGYFERASLASATVTIFTPLSGRVRLWESYAAWLQETWPRDQCCLILMDTSGDLAFGREVRQFLASCDYPDFRYIAEIVAEPGLADQPRRERIDAVRLVCARIYSRMAREVTTPFVLVVEDDILPPLGVIDQLLKSFDPGTAAVSAPYRSRLHNSYVVWDERDENRRGGDGVEAVNGTGFGCILLRREVLARETFRFGDGEPPDFDRAFSRRLRLNRRTIKVDWSQECQHRKNTMFISRDDLIPDDDQRG